MRNYTLLHVTYRCPSNPRRDIFVRVVSAKRCLNWPTVVHFNLNKKAGKWLPYTVGILPSGSVYASFASTSLIQTIYTHVDMGTKQPAQVVGPGCAQRGRNFVSFGVTNLRLRMSLRQRLNTVGLATRKQAGEFLVQFYMILFPFLFNFRLVEMRNLTEVTKNVVSCIFVIKLLKIDSRNRSDRFGWRAS